MKRETERAEDTSANWDLTNIQTQAALASSASAVPAGERVPGSESAPRWDFKDQLGVPACNPRTHADFCISLWPVCRSGFTLVWACKTWTVAEPGAWLPWPPPGAQQSQDPSRIFSKMLHVLQSQQTVTVTPPGQRPGRWEARSEARSALSLKPKQDYLFNFPNTLMKTKLQPKVTPLDPNSSSTIAWFPRPPLE